MDPAQLRKALAGDQDAFDQLYRDLSPRLSGFCRYLARDEADARDLFQATWARVLERREGYREDLSFEGWVLSLARNLWVDGGRRRRVERRALELRARELREMLAPPPDPLPLREALDVLSEEDREAFLLYRTQGLSLREVGRILGVTPWVVRERLARAQETLERLLKIR